MAYNNSKPSFNRGSFNSNSRSNSSGFGGRRPSRGGRGGRFKKYIDPALFVKVADIKEDVVIEENNIKFTDLNLNPIIIEALKEKGYEKPTPIQAKAIPHILEGKDVIGLADTGTGKTMAFLLPLLDATLKENKTKTLILAPTRELALQIEQELRSILNYSMKIFVTSCIGGTNIRKQMFQLNRYNQFVIATPGRLQDLVDRKAINLSEYKHVVLDEVDRMLDMGFINEIKAILSMLPEKRQSLFFSATTEGKTQDLMKQFLKDPVTIEISKNTSSENVHQDIVKVLDNEVKLDKLIDILNQEVVAKALIFCGTKMAVDRLWKNLKESGFSVESMHGDKTQMHRQVALKKFKSGEAWIMIGTDVAARGIDVKDITHVINYETPQTYEDYIHRVGRAGRGGNIGWALTFIDDAVKKGYEQDRKSEPKYGRSSSQGSYSGRRSSSGGERGYSSYDKNPSTKEGSSSDRKPYSQGGYSNDKKPYNKNSSYKSNRSGSTSNSSYRRSAK